METQNQTQSQVQTQPQVPIQAQPQQSFDVKETLSKLDKYNNVFLSSILVGIGVISSILYLLPLFDLKIDDMSIGFSLSSIAAIGSLFNAISQIMGSFFGSASNANTNTGDGTGFVALALVFSLVIILIPLLQRTKRYTGFVIVPALANCIIFFMVNKAFSPNNTTSDISRIFGGDITCSINFFGYVYIIVQIAAILIGALILYRNNEAKKAAAGMATPMNTYQGTVPSVTPQYSVANTAPVASAPTTPAPVQPQTASQPQFCPNCGNKVEPGTKFCGNCGASIN